MQGRVAAVKSIMELVVSPSPASTPISSKPYRVPFLSCSFRFKLSSLSSSRLAYASASLFFARVSSVPVKSEVLTVHSLSCDSVLLSDSQGSAFARRTDTDAMGQLLRERIVFLGNNIDDFVADSIMSQVLLLDARDHTKDIRLLINSPGGSLSAAMAIYDVLQLVRAEVSTIALGISASTASIILGGGTKGKRLAMPNTRIMIHQPLGGASGQTVDVEIQAKEVAHNKNNITRIISGFTGRPFEQVEKDIDRDRYMSPMEAVEYGIIDGVIDKDRIIPLAPVPDRVKPRFTYEEMGKDPRKFLTPDISDDEIY